MGCYCNLFGRVISITSPKSLDGVAGGRSSSNSKKKWQKRRRHHRGGPMDVDEEGGYIDYGCSPHPALPPAYEGQPMARSVIYSNDSPLVVMQAPAATGNYSPLPPASYAYASPAPVVVTAAAVLLEQQGPPPSKSRVRFALPGGGDGGGHEEPVLANPIGPPVVADAYYKHPQHERYHQGVQQVVRSHEVEPTAAGRPGCGTYHLPPPPHPMPPTGVPPEYGHYNYGYPTPGRDAVYRIGTDANRFSMFSDENPNACAIA